LIAFQLRRKHSSRLLWAFWLAGNGLGMVLLFAVARYPTSLYVRNALFSEVFDSEQFRTQKQLNALLAKSLRHDPPQLKPRSLFTPTELIKLDGLVQASQAADCRVPTDHPKTRLTAADCTARALAEEVSPYMMGGKCGLDLSIRARIGSVRNGVGCCSDYNEAFLLRAQAVGLQAREVHNLGHTTAEYFDPIRQRWAWIDTSNRIQMSGWDGLLLNAFERSTRFPWRQLTFVDLLPFTTNQEKNGQFSPGYQANTNGVLYWTRGVNLLEQERFEEPFRKFGLPREVIQAVSLTLGVRPGWIVVAPAEAAFRFRLGAWLLKGFIVLFVVCSLAFFLAAMGWRLSRNRSFL
jgi:hypothetical protein